MIDRQNIDAQNLGPGSAPRKSCTARNFVVALGVLASALFAIGACSTEGDRTSLSFGMGGGGGQGNGSLGSGVAQGPCKEGAEQECGFTVNQDDQVLTCFHGIQECRDDGTWGDCIEGELVTKPVGDDLKKSYGKFNPLTLSTQPHVGCDPLDRCDPRCVEVAEGTAVFTPGTQVLENELCDVGDTISECSAIPGCEHSLCSTGVGLTAAKCGTCATKVCDMAVMPSCCNGSGNAWDASCVAKAYELCLNAPPPLGLCDFGIYSETSLTTANQPSFGNQSTIGSVGNLTIGTDSAGQFPNRVVTKGDLWINNANKPGPITVSGGMWAAGSIGFKAGTNTGWTMDVRAGEGVYLYGQNTITGKVYTSSDYANSAEPGSNSYNISGQSGAGIAGTAYASTTAEVYTGGGLSVTAKAVNPFPVLTAASINTPNTVPDPTTTTCSGTSAFPVVSMGPSISGSTPNQSVTIDGKAYSLPPGNYGTVSLMNGGKLVLSSNASAYTFKAINGGGNNGGIQLQASTGTYNVTVCGTFSLGTNASIIDSSASTTTTANTPVLTDPSRLVMYVLATGTAVNLGNDVNFTGVLVVPNGTFQSGNNNNHNNCSVMPWNSAQCTKFTGAVWAAGFNVGTYFNLVQIGKTQCEGLSLSGTTPTPLPASCSSLDSGVTFSKPALPPSTVQPCRWGADCQNNQHCADVESRVGSIACIDFNKCVASGTSPVPSTRPCAADPCVQQIIANHSSCGSNWTATCVGYVQTECDATCGTPTTNRSGTCVDNAMAYSEPGCTGTNGYDLALGYACSASKVPVCNHGSTQFSGAIKVGFWNVTDRQFATLPGAAPNTTTMDGSCTQTLTIPAGSCTNMDMNATNCTPTTALIAGTNYTLMVDPSGVLSECGTLNNTSRRMDNWSWRESSFTCINNPAYSEYEYVTDCPDDSSGVWKYLKWVTDNSPGTQVQFLGKVARNLADLGAEAYIPLASNTTDCTEAQANALTAGCSVPLTTGLSLVAPQGQALSIRAEKTGTPTISKWEVSYTCQYDQ